MERDAKRTACELYVEDRYSLPVIAKKLNIHYNTVKNWAQLGKWKEARISRMARPARLSIFYLQQCRDMLANMAATECKITLDEIDIISRLMSAAGQLDRDMHLGRHAAVLKKFGAHLMGENYTLGDKFVKYRCNFIRDVINTDHRDIPALLPHVPGTENLSLKSADEPTKN